MVYLHLLMQVDPFHFVEITVDLHLTIEGRSTLFLYVACIVA